MPRRFANGPHGIRNDPRPRIRSPTRSAADSTSSTDAPPPARASTGRRGSSASGSGTGPTPPSRRSGLRGGDRATSDAGRCLRPAHPAELVARAADRVDPVRVRDVLLELLAQLVDEVVDRARRPVVVEAPDLVEDLVAREHAAAALDQQ